MTVATQRVQQRTILLVTPDEALSQRLADHLQVTEWTVLGARSGAEAIAHLHATTPEAMIVDHWLPDLETDEFVAYVAGLCPATDLLSMDGTIHASGGRSLRRHELLHVLRTVADQAPVSLHAGRAGRQVDAFSVEETSKQQLSSTLSLHAETGETGSRTHLSLQSEDLAPHVTVVCHLPELVGDSPAMLELSHMVRLVAPHTATVLLLGETGTGKELVAKAVHQLSTRASRTFVVLNCAAIPEQLLEAELFGHARGAFTGAVASRMGRIEAAHGGTLFLDEIGEMPLALQAKLLRFLENGEVQRVGDNETSRVDVRIVAATHQPLLMRAINNQFRLDLYHRLAVFPIDIAPLRDRREDIPMLVQYLLSRLGGIAGGKTMHADALRRLCHYAWDGNVRELGHVIHRAAIMAGSSEVITTEHLRMRERSRTSQP